MNLFKIAPVVLLVVAACTGFPFFSRKAQSLEDKASVAEGSLADCGQRQPRARMELQDVHYDGEYLSGRLLVTAEGGSLRLDKRLFTNIDVNVDSVLNCSTAQNAAYMVMDAFPPRGREEDLLILDPGYWYGTTVRFSLFAEELSGLGPECIDVQLSLSSFEGRCIGVHHVRAVRAPRESMDGGRAGESPPAVDAGSPDAGMGGVPLRSEFPDSVSESP
ncbi:MAG: hypothetical protein JXB05_12875 [Myxococcaceae bacterium]|nr:hypothetical protein [Myxococcaceae bacterium]